MGQLVDQPDRQFELALPDRGGLARVDLAKVAYLVGEVQGVEQEAGRRRADEDRALLAAQHEGGEGNAVGRGHGLGQEAVGLRPAFGGAQVVGPLEVGRVDPGQRHEHRDGDDRGGRALKGLQLLIGHGHVVVLGHFVPFDQLAALHHRVVDRTVRLLPNPGAARGVEQAEGDPGRDGRRIQPDRDGHQSERDDS